MNMATDGCSVKGVMAALDRLLSNMPSVITLTVGGNDLLEFALGLRQHDGDVGGVASVDAAAESIISNYTAICDRFKDFDCPVITNTIYDPTDGRNDIASMIGLSADWRTAYNRINDGIKFVARQRSFLCVDLQYLFTEHGIGSAHPWITKEIEPNLAGATAIASRWYAAYKRTSITVPG
jgi:lysophospholipase L1-like esterase